jgi:hypothetical protein
MSSSNKPADSGVREPPAPLIGSAVRQHPLVHPDPFADFAELMELVEALCPEWPARGPLRGDDFRI